VVWQTRKKEEVPHDRVLWNGFARLVYLGPGPERAASFKLFGNLFLMFMTVGVAEVLTFAKALDVRPEDAATIFDVFNPATSIGVRAKRMVGGDFASPSWELAMARKDARLMLEEGARGEVPLPMLPAIAAVMDHYLARGHAHDDWTVIGKDAITR
jgi:3-hydroxyisobutyrate dehydrogenase